MNTTTILPPKSDEHCGSSQESLFGDVYAAGAWRPLDLEGLLSDGWDEPWAAGPAGTSGLTPRDKWLGANDGVFYRQVLNTFSYTNGSQIGNGLTANSYSNTFSIFLPLSRRFELQIDTPFSNSNSTSTLPPGGTASSSTHNRFGDVVITPRVLLSESERVSQVFAMAVETPTGQNITGGGHTSLTPRYEFWSNPVGAWVARGGWGVNVPIDNSNNQTSGVGNFAIGRYLTKHEDLLGDLVVYGATNMTVLFMVPEVRRSVLGLARDSIWPTTGFYSVCQFHRQHPTTQQLPDAVLAAESLLIRRTISST